MAITPKKIEGTERMYYDAATKTIYERMENGDFNPIRTNGAALVAIVNPSGALLGSGSFEVVDDQTLDAVGTGFTFSGLDGSAAYIYRLTGVLIGDTSGGSGPVPSIILNGDTGNNYERLSSTLSTTYAGAAASAQALFACMPAVLGSGDFGIFTIDIYADTSILHAIRSEIYTNTGTGGVTYLTTGQWNAVSAAEITSILLSAAVVGAGRFGVGSRCQLSRLALAA